MIPYTFLLLLFISLVHAQLGGKILSPARNATVQVGKNTEIVFQYNNVGTGDYTVDIQIWQDAAVEQLIDNITINHPIKSGNSSGVHLDFVYNDTFTWKVPHGLNETFYLTVIEHVVKKPSNQKVALRSPPVMLHTSLANSWNLCSFAFTATVSLLTLSYLSI